VIAAFLAGVLVGFILAIICIAILSRLASDPAPKKREPKTTHFIGVPEKDRDVDTLSSSAPTIQHGGHGGRTGRHETPNNRPWRDRRAQPSSA
jgi:hypothetical protein